MDESKGSVLATQLAGLPSTPGMYAPFSRKSSSAYPVGHGLAWSPAGHCFTANTHRNMGGSWFWFCSFMGSPQGMHTCLKFLKGTNWTMSRRTGSPLGDLRIPSSPSSICMSLKSALPTPTMMTDMGRWEAWTMASRVSAMSVMTPSVRISRMKYCWIGWKPGEGGGREVGDKDSASYLVASAC